MLYFLQADSTEEVRVPEESNSLRPRELSWLRVALRRVIVRGRKYLNTLRGAEYAAMLMKFKNEVLFLRELIGRQVVRPQDRVGLIETLRYERKILLLGRRPWEDVREEVEFINGFLKRLSGVDWESLSVESGQYDRGKIWGSFRISEAEMLAALTMTCLFARYKLFEQTLRVGSRIQLSVEEDYDNSERRIVIRLNRLHPCTTTTEDGSRGVIFEADILSGASDKDGGDEMFGFLFKNGQAMFLDSNPDSDYTDRTIRAGLVFLRAEQ